MASPSEHGLTQMASQQAKTSAAPIVTRAGEGQTRETAIQIRNDADSQSFGVDQQPTAARQLEGTNQSLSQQHPTRQEEQVIEEPLVEQIAKGNTADSVAKSNEGKGEDIEGRNAKATAETRQGERVESQVGDRDVEMGLTDEAGEATAAMSKGGEGEKEVDGATGTIRIGEIDQSQDEDEDGDVEMADGVQSVANPKAKRGKGDGDSEGDDNVVSEEEEDDEDDEEEEEEGEPKNAAKKKHLLDEDEERNEEEQETRRMEEGEARDKKTREAEKKKTEAERKKKEEEERKKLKGKETDDEESDEDEEDEEEEKDELADDEEDRPVKKRPKVTPMAKLVAKTAAILRPSSLSQGIQHRLPAVSSPVCLVFLRLRICHIHSGPCLSCKLQEAQECQGCSFPLFYIFHLTSVCSWSPWKWISFSSTRTPAFLGCSTRFGVHKLQ